MRLIDMHSSWLVINSIVGCTNGCQYCLLRDSDKNVCSPKILGTPQETVNELLKFKYYSEQLPICLFPNTDIFINEENINYLLATLDELKKRNINNDLILITKCLIPEQVLTRLKEIIIEGRKVVVYLSYSGLDQELEPNVKKNDIIKNFQNLKDLGIPTIHYYRPFIPQNSDPKQIKETLELIHQYTPVSATMGLMYVPNMIEKQKFWEELKNIDLQLLKKAISIWPDSAWNYFYNDYDSPQFFYQTNTCALNTILQRPSYQYYDTYECKNYNNCDPEQRKRCQKAAQKIDQHDILKKLNDLLKKLNISCEYSYEFDDNNGLKLEGFQFDVKLLSYLSYLLGIKVYVSNGKGLNDTYNSSLNGAEPLIVRRREL